jgi:cell division protein FtsI (penicillin-binding protein 3)
MVSTIANGGTYIPPHVLLQSTDQMKGDPRLHAAPFHPVADLPETLPDGSHRVIKPFTAAEMRSIMEGIVTEGTGKSAALNGYSSAGKTGTAEKIDPATHTYSHTKLVASFAGFAPVNNPAISVAVVIDTPTTVEGYGGIVSAPVFSQLAQEVLEYLGIAHDRPLKTQQQMAQIAASVQPEDVQEQPAGGRSVAPACECRGHGAEPGCRCRSGAERSAGCVAGSFRRRELAFGEGAGGVPRERQYDFGHQG